MGNIRHVNYGKTCEIIGIDIWVYEMSVEIVAKLQLIDMHIEN